MQFFTAPTVAATFCEDPMALSLIARALSGSGQEDRVARKVKRVKREGGGREKADGEVNLAHPHN